MDCQENCPFLMVCGNCTDCKEYPHCSDCPKDERHDECESCFNCAKDEKHDSSVRGYHVDVFMNHQKQTHKYGVKYKTLR